jgi:hypothetical protein
MPVVSKLPSRTAVNFCLDLALLIQFSALAWVTFLLRLVFPPAPAAAGWTLWGWGVDQWAAVQFWLTVALALSALLHVMLHWSWVCGVVTSRLSRWRKRPIRWEDGVRTLYGVGLLLLILHVLGILLAIAALSVRQS